MSQPEVNAVKAAIPASEAPKLHVGFLKNNLREYGMLISLVAIMVLFQVLTDGTLLRPLNLTNLLLQNSYVVIMALGMLLVIVAGHIDLSVGSVCGFIGALAAVLMVEYEWHFVPTAIVSILAGAVIGAAQGWFVAFRKIPSFIVTLAGMLVFKGLTLALLAGQSVGPFPVEFQRLSSGFIPDPLGGDALRTTSLVVGALAAAALVFFKLRGRAKLAAHGMEQEPYAFFLVKNLFFAAIILFFSYLLSTYKGLPNVLIVMAVLIVVYDFVTNRTTIGRRIYALGGNEGGATVGREDAAARVPHLREHGCAGGAGGPGVRGAAQHGHAQGGPGLRARRDRGLLHRRRIGLGRRGPGDGRGDRRLHHGRDEQRHVDPGHRHRLPASHQGAGAAGGGVHRRLQQEQVTAVHG